MKIARLRHRYWLYNTKPVGEIAKRINRHEVNLWRGHFADNQRTWVSIFQRIKSAK